MTNISKRDWRKNLPLWITSSRIIAGPALFLFLFMSERNSLIAMAILFMIASFTDYLDGYYARKFNATSTMGKFMDPIADKVLVLGALLLLLQMGKVDPIMVMLILGRDIFIGGIRSVAAADQVIIDAKATGKWKTAIQMMAIPALFLDFIDPTQLLGRVAYWTLWVSVVLSLISGWEYTKKYFEERK
jgi:CDP-diacylglycerol--glycerol-3-phosphate 3-phosphatidyltransferase